MFGKTVRIALLVLIISYAYNIYSKRKEPGIIFETETGKISSSLKLSRDGNEYYEILGIPYAKSPTGNLRFESPQRAENWEGIRDGSEYGAECKCLDIFLGSGIVGDEDCLFLNVFTPKKRNGLLPVMFFIHGGAFVVGSGNMYTPKYFIDEDVILVTINYRLNALGFLNTGDGVVRGNMGLKDQTAALQWVQRNIKNFGGDPSKVLIFGESAGGGSVTYHLTSPMSKGLFSKAISQSGTPYAPWASYPDPVEQTKLFASRVNCPTDDSKKMVECMKKMDIDQLIAGHSNMLEDSRKPISLFKPTVETINDKDTFLPEESSKLVKTGKVNKVPLIIGVDKDEGLLLSLTTVVNKTKLQFAEKNWDTWSSTTLEFPYNPDISKKIQDFYFGTEKIGKEEFLPAFTNVVSDRLFFVPHHHFVNDFAKHAPTYSYYFTYQSKHSLSFLLSASHDGPFGGTANFLWNSLKKWFKTKILRMKVMPPGVCHGDELTMLFDWAISGELTKDDEEYEFSKKIVKLWTDFVKDEKLKLNGVEWTPTKPGKLTYLEIAENPKMIDEPFSQRVKFWDSIKLE